MNDNASHRPLEPSTVDINGDRLWRTLMALAQIGGFDDEQTGLRGVDRLALTDRDAQGRRKVCQWFAQAGLDVRIDRIGNVIGRRPGRDNSLAPVMCGSHIDSVPTGGAFDGALGLIGALEVVRSLNDAGIETQRPIDIGFWTDEEGARFGTDMLGSGVVVGRIPLEEALNKEDRDGVTVRNELARIGFAGTSETFFGGDHQVPFAFLEVHIEQGPVLESQGYEIGVVTGVQSIAWREVVFEGRSAHAGTTPMDLRRDAGLAAAKVTTFVHEMAVSGRFGDHMRATVGRLDLEPQRINIVPRRALMTIDLRNPDREQMVAAETALEAYIAQVAQAHGLTYTCELTARTEPVTFDRSLREQLASLCERRGLRYLRLLSGAGHDAQEFAALCPTAMLFVPGLYEGISHNPREYSTPQACAAGVQVLADAMVALAGIPAES